MAIFYSKPNVTALNALIMYIPMNEHAHSRKNIRKERLIWFREELTGTKDDVQGRIWST